MESLGLSYENREMLVIKISSGGGEHRPEVLVDAGIHAREWIAPAMALYIINQLVENNATNSDLTDGVDWFIVPVLNPDGYEYSHNTVRDISHLPELTLWCRTNALAFKLIKMCSILFELLNLTLSFVI